MISKPDKKHLDDIEKKLKNYKYEQIPHQFIRHVNNNFEMFSYLKSLLEMKKYDS